MDVTEIFEIGHSLRLKPTKFQSSYLPLTCCVTLTWNQQCSQF